MGVDHLGAGGLAQEIQRIWRELRRVAKATLNNGSIGGAGLRVYGGGEIRFEQGGGVRILGDGYIDIDGDLTGAGDLSWTGPWNLSGLGTVTGDVAWSGDLNLTGNITVLPGGKIQVGDMIIDPADGGKVIFPNDAIVQADPGGGIRMIQGLNRVYVGSGLVSMQYGSRTIALSASGQRMDGLPTTPSSLANAAPVGTIWSDTSGQLFRVVTG